MKNLSNYTKEDCKTNLDYLARGYFGGKITHEKILEGADILKDLISRYKSLVNDDEKEKYKLLESIIDESSSMSKLEELK
jgi:hypothetical protein